MQTPFTEELNLQLMTMLMEQLLYMNNWQTQSKDGMTVKSNEDSILSSKVNFSALDEKFVVNHYRLFKLYTDKLKKENDDQKEQLREYLNAFSEMQKELTYCKQKMSQQKIEISQKDFSLQQLTQIEELVSKHQAQQKIIKTDPVKQTFNFKKEHSNETNEQLSNSAKKKKISIVIIDNSPKIANSPQFGIPNNQNLIRPIHLLIKPEDITKKIIKTKSKLQRIFRNKRGSWTPKELNRYLRFIEKYTHIFVSPFKIAKHKSIFSKLSRFVRTRTVAQCQKHNLELSVFKAELKLINMD